MKEEIKARGLENEVNVVRTGCFGLCALGPIVVIYPEGSFTAWSRKRTSRKSWTSTC